MNIFGEIDIMNEAGEIFRCEICKKPLDKQADVCSTKCGEEWINRVFP